MRFELEKESMFTKVLTNSENSIILFGASSFGSYMKNVFESFNMNIRYFCDNDIGKHGKEIGGIKIISPSELVALGKENLIVITSTYYKEIYEQLKELGFGNIFCFSPWFLYEHKNGALRETISNNMSKIKELYNLLEDNKSREVLENIINYRITFNIDYLMNAVNSNKMYFDEDILKLNGNESFLDAGAFDGDTVLEFINFVRGEFNNIYAFEPDKVNFDRLTNNTQLLSYKNKIKFEKSGLYKDSLGITFENHHNMGSHIVKDDSNNSISTISIDDYSKKNEISFIKMDIEGAEIDAILGGSETLKKHKPKLAICIYHRMDDLWEIPLLIKKIQPEYKIFIRQHAYNLYDSVCYAI
ncbi:FkbM family methyltransferase [Clostridium beijerinckii]|uniref:Methyltransferase FkbM domain-containing protein n=1 Tax=Clostridium beijerinckii TaxID=1520 RepID=A0A1S8S6G6_CLOBE|nr:FkbM family methyltransferase [Clostridium beijerinckii]NRY60049.1 FkbM family methyltransferase [Clostridium beijerinckii]OOM60905.1 hypothetical protein CLBCK_26220 [Clostridium beijerinckii]